MLWNEHRMFTKIAVSQWKYAFSGSIASTIGDWIRKGQCDEWEIFN